MTWRVARLDAGFVAGLDVHDLDLNPRRSIQRWYMRRSMSAQSHDSVPPAPELSVRKQLRRSFSPDMSCLSSKSASSFSTSRIPRRTPRACSPCLAVRFLVGEFFEGADVVDLALDLEEGTDLAAQGGDFLDLLLREFLAIPETRLGHGRFQFAQARLQLGEVKDTSAVGRRGP